MRTAEQISKGLTNLERKHLESVNERENKKNRKVQYKKPEISEDFNSKNIVQIVNPPAKSRQMYANYGQEFMNKQKLGLIIFAGGYGCRAAIDYDEPKQFSKFKLHDRGSYRMKKNQQPVLIQTTLFEIVMKSLRGPLSKNKNITVYIICSRKNSKAVADEVERMKADINQQAISAPIYICYQPQSVILDWNGLENVYLSKKEEKKLQYPNGLGTFLQSKVLYGEDGQYTLGYHLTSICQIQLAYCIGTANKKEVGINLELLGFITQHKLSCVFQCSFPEASPVNELPMISLRKEQGFNPAWLVMEYNNYAQLIKQQQLKTYPVWMDNFVFNTKIMTQKHEYNKSVLRYEFNLRNLIGFDGKILKCLIPEVTISSAVMQEKQKSIGYLCLQGKFMKIKSDFTNSEFEAKSLSPSRIVKRPTF